MKNYLKMIAVVALIGFALSSCATRQHVLSVAAISMTETSKDPAFKTEKLGAIEAEYCQDSYSATTGKDIGLIDEAVKKAQVQAHADVLENVDVYKSANCVIVSGTAVKFQR
jgi:hypothetical protein